MPLLSRCRFLTLVLVVVGSCVIQGAQPRTGWGVICRQCPAICSFRWATSIRWLSLLDDDRYALLQCVQDVLVGVSATINQSSHYKICILSRTSLIQLSLGKYVLETGPQIWDSVLGDVQLFIVGFVCLQLLKFIKQVIDLTEPNWLIFIATIEAH